ncbi:MAG: hypothetical protein ACE5FL_03740 [Myxococcota bacterium]
MPDPRSQVRGRRAFAVALAVPFLWLAPRSHAGGGPDGHGAPLGHGAPIGSYEKLTRCELAVYRGPETPLYSNRPYHTTGRAEAAVGLQFCRGPRHGTQLWIVEASAPTTLVAFAAESFGLEVHGWSASPAPVRVAAAGVPLDRIYTRDLPAGRYVVRQAFAHTAIVVFWDPAVVRLAR